MSSLEIFNTCAVLPLVCEVYLKLSSVYPVILISYMASGSSFGLAVVLVRHFQCRDSCSSAVRYHLLSKLLLGDSVVGCPDCMLDTLR